MNDHNEKYCAMLRRELARFEQPEPLESERHEADALLIEKLELQSVRLAAENAMLQARLKTVCEDAIEAMHLNDMTTFNILYPFTESGMRVRAQAEVKAQEVNEG